MTEAEALEIKRKFEQFCEKHGVWCKISEVKKPHLKAIEIEASIKITKK